eukprot:9731043-Karenia_brevis.AAC.1
MDWKGALAISPYPIPYGDLNMKWLFNEFAYQMHRSKSLNAALHSEICSEFRRICCGPQWLKPTCVPSWGLGADITFPETEVRRKRVEDLFSVITEA